jgi:putative endopeptidase
MNSHLLISGTLLSIALYSCKSTQKPVSSESFAPTEKPVAKELNTIDLGYLDNSIRPEEDFFQFSNGTWIKNNPIPASESRWGSFNELENNNKRKLIEILEALKTNSNAQKGSDAYILGRYFASFTNMEKRNQLDISPIQADLDKVKNLKSKSEIVGLIAEQHMYGINSLFSFGVGQDLKNVEKNITYLGQAGIGLPNKDYYLAENKKDIREKYKAHVGNMFKLIGYTETESLKKAENVLSIETKLAEAMMSPAELRVPENTYNKKSLDDAAKLFGKLDFEDYLSAVGSLSFDSIVVSQPDFIKKTAELLEKEDIAIWKDYLTWKTLRHYAGNLSERFVNESFNFYGKTLSGKSEMKPTNERAIDEITNKDFGELLGKAFVEKYFSANAQKRVNTMVDNLLVVFGKRIENLDWMSAETKKEAQNKLNSIGRKLGFPSKWEDYSALDFGPEAYVENIKTENKFSFVKNLNDLKKPVDKEKWGMPAHMVNAYYHPLLNEIAFPAGIMQPPFFDENAEDAVNYGRIGMVIGHEFTHGFDDMGSKFAADGSFKNWWTEADRTKFEEKTTTLGETFSAFCPIEGHCVNPQLTMGENIADLGGLTMAYYAYTLTDEFKSGKVREGYSPAQRFFIAYAQLWKIKYTEAEMKNRIANDPHSPGMYRVNGPLKNCPEFFEAFGVKEGAKMRNPSAKVAKIW